MKTGKIIRELRMERQMTLEELGKLIGVQRAAVQKWEDGTTVNLKRGTIQRLSEIFDVSPTYIMGMSSVKHPTKALRIPLLGTIAAGTPILAEENITEYFNLDSSIRADFALRVQGDSMIEAGIFPDDIAFFRQQSCLDNGQVGAVLIDNEATLKTFYRTNDSIILQPANKKYPPIILTEDIRVLGLLVAVLNRRDV